MTRNTVQDSYADLAMQFGMMANTLVKMAVTLDPRNNAEHALCCLALELRAWDFRHAAAVFDGRTGPPFPQVTLDDFLRLAAEFAAHYRTPLHPDPSDTRLMMKEQWFAMLAFKREHGFDITIGILKMEHSQND